MAERFTGFRPESIEFFDQLAAHNERDWFLAHKDVYERECRAPMQALVGELEPKYGKAKVSRIYRDLRFSPNRAPYKTYIAAGLGGRYISLSPKGVYIGAGFRQPDADWLRRFRAAIDDETTGRQLQSILRSLQSKGYEVSAHDKLSSAPRGYAADHPRIELLKMKDIAAGRLFAPGRWLATARARQRIDRVMSDTGPLVAWLQKHVAGRRGTPTRRGGRR